MIQTISRPPNDDFTFSIFSELLSQLTHEFEAYYIWSYPDDQLFNFLSTTQFSKPNVIIGIKDLLNSGKAYDYWRDSAQVGTGYLDLMASKHTNKNFIIFTSLENVELEKITSTNLQFVHWGGDITNQADLYPGVSSVLDKNFNSDKTFISLNRGPRTHRLILLSYLFGAGYNTSGYLTFLGQEKFSLPNCIFDMLSWPFENKTKITIQDGYKKFYNNPDLSIIQYELIYPTPNNNVDNFTHRLAPLYRNSFVELVTEPSFTPPSFLLTEKTLNSIYGCNFPIILSGAGTIQHLRNIGFDMFDDIVDHGYDQIANPADRIILAIENNKQLLVDSEHVKKLWRDNQYRFENNVRLASTKLYQWFRGRAVAQFREIKLV